MLKSWWGGGAGEGELKVADEEQKSGGEGETENKPEAQGNSWVVKGFGDLMSNVTSYASNLKDTATNLKDTVSTTVQSTSFLSEFAEEQKKFERERQRQKDSAVPPWVGYNEEEQMKAQILELSSDSRNVLRNPPPGIQFHFDFAKSYPVALALLKEDPRLQKLRFELVPKKLKEEQFWQNYFYRVFLIRQSSQLASLNSVEQRATSSPSSQPNTDNPEQEQDTPTSLADLTEHVDHQDTQGEAGEDFASDALVVGEGTEEQPTISRESVRAELDQLGVQQQPSGGDTEQWEEELAKELEDMGLEGEEGGGSVEADEHWEDELKLMLDSHPTDTAT